MAAKIIYLVASGDTQPSVRYRVLPFIEKGRERGLDIDRIRIPKAIHKRLFFLLTLPKCHAFIIQSKLFAPWELKLIKRKCDLLVFDFDDAVWALPPHDLQTSSRQRDQRKYQRRFTAQCAAADLCVCGNSFLAERAGEHQSNVRIMPTGLDLEFYKPGTEPHEGFTVGWIGTAGNFVYVEMVLEEMRRSGKVHDLYVVSSEPYQGPLHEKVFWDKWTPNDVVNINRMDVGLMPLYDNEYTRGKCGGKALCYMACGVVPIVSAVGANNDIIEHGKDGFLVRRPEEWSEYITLLRQDPELRLRMGRAARQKMIDHYSVQTLADRLWGYLGV